MSYKPFSFCILFLFIIFFSCGESDKKSKSRELLPRASLVPHELLVVMDSSQWNGVLGEAIRDVFTEPLAGLPQEEPQFKISYVAPHNLKGFLRRYPNILFAFTLDKKSRSTQMLQSMFSGKSLEQIQEDPQRYMLARKDEFAKGQEVMYLFGNSEDQLTNKIYANKQALLDYFQDVERKRYMRDFANIKANRPLSQRLSRKYGFSFNLPAGYEIAKEDENFVWIRLLDSKVDKSVWATWKPYTNQEIFKTENLLRFRNSVARNYIWGSDTTTYMRLEEQIPVVSREVNFNGRFAIETRGLWRLEKMAMGGPFISYTFVDKSTNRIYYIEGFTYAPGQDKREAVSELEAILWSFNSTENQKK